MQDLQRASLNPSLFLLVPFHLQRCRPLQANRRVRKRKLIHMGLKLTPNIIE